MTESKESDGKQNEITAEQPKEKGFKILVLEERLKEQGISWDMLNWHAKNGRFNESLPASEECKERKKMTFPDNLSEYKGLAESCLNAIDDAYTSYYNEKYGSGLKGFISKIFPLINPPSKLEILRRVTFAIKMATASYTDSKMIFGTRY